MSPRRTKKAPSSPRSSARVEKLRERQRAACLKLLDRWLPIAATETLAIRKEGRAGPVIDEEPLEAALKAGAFILKLLERLSRLDGLDAPEKQDSALSKMADPVELARRVRIVSPILIARLHPESSLSGALPEAERNVSKNRAISGLPIEPLQR